MSEARIDPNEQQTVVEGEIIEPGNGADGLPMVSASALELLTRGEIDIQISTARRYPRSLAQFKQKAITMATMDEETAASCFYRLPRGGKTIEGPSVRLAEIAASAWGNIRKGARVIDIDANYVTAQGFCHDLETNNATQIEVKRRITDKKGRRFNDDMIMLTANAACAIAKRNAVLDIVPQAYIRTIKDAAKQTAVGDIKTLEQRKGEMIGYFARMGVTQERVLAAIEKPSVEDVDLEDLLTLKGLATGIRDGEFTVDDAFPKPKEGESNGRAAALAEKINKKKEAASSNGHGKHPQQQQTQATDGSNAQVAASQAEQPTETPKEEQKPEPTGAESGLQDLYDQTIQDMREALTARGVDAALSKAMKHTGFKDLGAERQNRIAAFRTDCKAKLAEKKREPGEEG